MTKAVSKAKWRITCCIKIIIIMLDQHKVVMFAPYTSQHSDNSVADIVIAYPMSITN